MEDQNENMEDIIEIIDDEENTYENGIKGEDDSAIPQLMDFNEIDSADYDIDEDQKSHKDTKNEDKVDNNKKKSQSNDYSDSEFDSDDGINEFNTEAEDFEKECLRLPPLQNVMNELTSLREGRKLTAQPLKIEELNHPDIIDIFANDHCDEIKIHFVRSKENDADWKGFMFLNFSSCNVAKLATEKIKSIRDDLDVKSQKEAAFANKIMEQWVRDEKRQKLWTDTMVYVKNVAENITEEKLMEIFPDCEDIVICKGYSNDKKKEKDSVKLKDALVFYQSQDKAERAASDLQNVNIELEGQKLKIFKYHVPNEIHQKGLLKLSERKVVLKYMDRLSQDLDKDSAEGDEKAPRWCKKRFEVCQSVLEKDNKSRTLLNFSIPNYEELCALKIKSLRGANRKDTLIRLGIIDRSYRKNHNYNNYPYNGKSSDKKKSYDQTRSSNSYRSRNSNQSSGNARTSLLGNPPNLINMPTVVPPLLAMQHNIGMMRLMMEQSQMGGMSGINSLGLAGNNLSARNSNQYLTGTQRYLTELQPPKKLMCLDDTGLYRNYNSGGTRGPIPLMGNLYDMRNKKSGYGNKSNKTGGSGKRPVSLLDL